MSKTEPAGAARIVWVAPAIMALALVSALEIFAILMLWGNADGNHTLLMYLLQRAASSLLLAMIGHYFLCKGRSKPKRWLITLLLFNFIFFIPLLGAFSVLLVVLVAAWPRRPQIRAPFASLVMPEFALSIRETAIHFGQGGVRSILTQASIPAPKRLQSLLALQGMPSRISSPLLHERLEDVSDDIRLIAYGLLDSRKKVINAGIHREMLALRQAGDDKSRQTILRHLAELYWEMVYSRLAQGDLRLYALQQALSCAEQALKLSADNDGLQFLKARILLELGNLEEATEAFAAAAKLGTHESRILPYLAEIAFYRKQYGTACGHLQRLAAYQPSPIMQNIIKLCAVRPDDISKRRIIKGAS